MDRRGFLVRSGLALAAWQLAEADVWAAKNRPGAKRGWGDIRKEFNLDPTYLHFGLLYLTSHPRAVREAIDAHRTALDGNPVRYLQENGDWPRTMALSAWGTANMRTGGDDIAQALALMGARPTWDTATGRVTGFEIMPPGT